MVQCKVCNKTLKNNNGLAKHITNQHSMTKEEYYKKYINEVSSTCVCGKEKTFRGLGEGYRRYCSCQCRSDNIETTRYWQGKSQPQEMIEARRKTMIERHGVSNGFLTNHSRAEYYKGLLCRSGYEKLFVDFAEEHGYTLSVPDRISYVYEDRSRHYYPDFYINELDLTVEIKSKWTWDLHRDMNEAKQRAGIECGYNMLVVSEEHGLVDQDRWDQLNAYLMENA
jgi:hypothetical protein